MMSCSVPFFGLANVCGIHISTRIRLVLIIGLVLIIHAASESPLSTDVQYYIHFATGRMLKPMYDSHPCLANAMSQWPLSRFMLWIQILWNYLCRSLRLYFILHIGSILDDNFPVANLPSTHQCMPLVSRTLYIKFQLQIMTLLMNEWTHKKDGMYYLFHFCPRSYGIIAICSILHQPVCVSNIVKQML